MADRYEPKLSVRPMSERKPAQAPDEDDPLFELTRMISGRSTFDPAPAPKSKTVPAAASAAGDANLGMDLESELMSDLQASFGIIRDGMAPPPTAKAVPASAPAAPTPLRPTPPSAPASSFAPSAAASAPAPRPVPPPSPVAPAASAPAPRGDRVAPPIPPRSERQGIPVAPQLPKNERPVLQAAPPASAPAAPTLGERTSIFRSNNGPTVDLSHLQMRPTAAPPAPPPKANVPRWGAASGEVKSPAAAEAPSRFAPPRAAAVPPPKSEAPEIDVGEEPFELAPEDEFALEDLSALPEYGDNEVPFPEDELAGLSRRRNNRAIAIIASLLVIALAGGLAYFMFSNSTGSAPPIIAADPTPTKVVPDPAADAQVAAKDSDRVDSLDTSGETTLVKPDETSVAALPPENDPQNPISRVLLPAGPGYDEPAADGSDDPSQIGPKKVRTVVVRPDGTIVSTEAVAADGSTPPVVTAPAAAPPPASDATLPLEPTATPPKETGMDTVLNGKGIPVDTDPLAGTDTTAAEPVVPPPVSEPTADATPPAAPSGTVPATDPAEPVIAAPAPPMNAVPPPKPVKPVKPVVVAAKPVVVAAKPIELTPVSAAPEPAIPAGGALVQLSSQKSEDAARVAYAGLQRKFASILGPFKPNIARADLGDRGIYYRVRVGPFSSADATRLCEDLRAAGGECIIAR